MKGHFRVPSLIFYGISLLMVVVSVVSFVAALSWVNKPFAGFLVYEEPIVGSMRERDWPGFQAGIKFLDRIDLIGGEPVRQGPKLVDLISRKRPGTPVTYLVSVDGKTREISIPVSFFSLKDFLLVFFVPFFSGLFICALGVIAHLLKPNMRATWVFLFCCLSLGGYMVSGFEIQSTYSLVRFHYLSLCFYPAFFLHLGLIFPERKHVLSRFPALEALIYVPPAILCLGYEWYSSAVRGISTSDSGMWVPAWGTLFTSVRMLTLVYFVTLISLLFHSYLRASTMESRQRARVIFFGLILGSLPPASIMALGSFMNIKFPWNFLPVFVIFFPAAFAYSIVRHNLFDADIIIRRTVGYAVVTVIVIGAYVGVSLGLNVFLGKYDLAHSQAFPILFTLGIILVFNPLRNWIQALVDRVFFRKEYDYGKIIDTVSGAITSVLDLGQILKRMTQTFIEDMYVNTASVMLLTSAGGPYQVFLADGERKAEVDKTIINHNDPLMEIFDKEKRELTKYDVAEDPKYREVSGDCKANFEALSATLMVPLVYQDQVIGTLNLGEKKSGKTYNRQDIELLRALANQGAVAIENARLFKENLEKQRMEEELSIARDLQMSMLPAACPDVKGFQIAATSIPAREVGGDFFDFIEMEDQKLGFVIGDVTGKSVSGALVMSASRSVFRMLSEERLTVGEIMIRANRRTKKDIKGGMFVALLYAVVDGGHGTVSICSAGQTQPIHFSARTGEAALVETQGDTFPLGILEEADYRETTLKLERGDIVVFYTDGIVEAMNEDEEIFGFERLLEVVRSAGDKGADELLKEILDRVNAFVVNAPQHDDLTVIVLNVENGKTETRKDEKQNS
jgi:sigma-B regulation protein RsbU (phosphoserine phosphatase)